MLLSSYYQNHDRSCFADLPFELRDQIMEETMKIKTFHKIAPVVVRIQHHIMRILGISMRSDMDSSDSHLQELRDNRLRFRLLMGFLQWVSLMEGTPLV